MWQKVLISAAAAAAVELAKILGELAKRWGNR
jgi:hypothetical protein